MVDEGDLAQWLTLGRTKVTLGVPQWNAASCIHLVGDSQQPMYISFMNTADRGNRAADTQGSRGKHQVLAGTAKVGAGMLSNHEYQHGRFRIVVRIRAEMQGSLP